MYSTKCPGFCLNINVNLHAGNIIFELNTPPERAHFELLNVTFIFLELDNPSPGGGLKSIHHQLTIQLGYAAGCTSFL